ncbi:aminophospholipid ATPase 2 [Actinidia rufa]|uniref:Aminophospholipid ATPase 2 n=1 Tax=Actinidia rufa TaxID=165716 RepID=A0A7J0FK10_9ERIC|nr:aminophospholipid ATPase 2 [Actinidia rufa]
MTLTAALDGETDLKTRGVIECPNPDKDIRRFDANLRLFPPFIDNDEPKDDKLKESRKMGKLVYITWTVSRRPWDMLESLFSTYPLILSHFGRGRGCCGRGNQVQQMRPMIEDFLVSGAMLYRQECVEAPMRIPEGNNDQFDIPEVSNETKLGMSRGVPEPKLTAVDAMIDKLTGAIFIFQIVVVIVLGIAGNVWKDTEARKQWYVQYPNEVSWHELLVIPLRFELLCSIMIPISVKEIALDLNSSMTSIVNVATSSGSQIWHNGVTSGGKALNFKILVSVAMSSVDDFNLNSGETRSVDGFCIVASVISEQLFRGMVVGRKQEGGGLGRGEWAGSGCERKWLVVEVVAGEGVSLDLVKSLYAKFIDWDSEMIDLETGTPALAANTAISEDLGQVEYIMTDKTGTLTENRMIFKRCCISGRFYGNESGDALKDVELVNAVASGSPDVIRFLTVMAICNTVIPIRSKSGSISYKAQSQDEEALVRAAACLHMVFVNKSADVLEINLNGAIVQFDVLDTLEFTSDRKRMSVVVKDCKSGKIVLLSKGADEALLPCAHTDGLWLSNSLAFVWWCVVDGRTGQVDGEEKLPPKAGRTATGDIHENIAILHAMAWLLGISLTANYSGQQMRNFAEAVEQYAQLGLRTLCLAWRELEEDEYREWSLTFRDANSSLVDREWRVAEVCQRLEHDFEILGVAAIEDRLQDGVPETIKALRQAGINFWMLTGDKQNTAVQIALSCNFVSPEPKGQLLLINGKTEDEVCSSLEKVLLTMRTTNSEPKDVAFAIDGWALEIALKHYRKAFTELALLSRTAICCRVTPSQKAQLVELVKSCDYKTLAIGDGGNDVRMIQEADIGVGISGREGLQAARAADYSIGNGLWLSNSLAFVWWCVVDGRTGQVDGEEKLPPKAGRTATGDIHENIAILHAMAWLLGISLTANYSGQQMRNFAEAVEQYAQLGLRTLCLAWRELEEDEYREWSLTFRDANSSLVDREWRVAEVCQRLEHDFEILGVAAIEDRLQDGVPETIKALRQAGINFWMLTGDKQNTAVQIALSCNFVSPG